MGRPSHVSYTLTCIMHTMVAFFFRVGVKVGGSIGTTWSCQLYMKGLRTRRIGSERERGDRGEEILWEFSSGKVQVNFQVSSLGLWATLQHFSLHPPHAHPSPSQRHPAIPSRQRHSAEKSERAENDHIRNTDNNASITRRNNVQCKTRCINNVK